MLDGVYRTGSEAAPVFHEARAPTLDELQALLARIIMRILKRLTRRGYLVEEQGMTYRADAAPDNALTALQAASCTYRIALGPRAGQKVLSLRTLSSRDRKPTHALCANAHGFSLHAGLRLAASVSARNSNACAATSPARRLPTSASNATARARWCCN